MTIQMKSSRFIALLGSIFTLVQIYLLASEKKGICLNSGCEIVDSLTAIPPIFINIGGFVFFQLIFWGLWLGRQNSERLNIVNIILLAGLAAEGVLVGFQHYVAETFCSYCLIILGLIVALNLLAGLRHFVAGSAIFFAVILGFSSLQMGGAKANPLEGLDKGSFAYTEGESGEKRYLFFSSTCTYCEKVIESIKGYNDCGVRFNPIDQITDFALDSASRTDSYDTGINRRILQLFGLKQIPVLLISSDTGFQVINGAGTIEQYLARNCTSNQEIPTVPAPSKSYPTSSSGLDFLPPVDESCAVDTDCEDPESIPFIK